MTMHIDVDNPKLEEQLKRFAKETGQTIDALASNFLEQGIDVYKNSPKHVTGALLRWSEYEKTGQSVSKEEIADYVKSLRAR